MPEYATNVHKLVEKHGGRYLSRSGNIETFEGEEKDSTLIAILEFPTRDALDGFAADPEYAPYGQPRCREMIIELNGKPLMLSHFPLRTTISMSFAASLEWCFSQIGLLATQRLDEFWSRVVSSPSMPGTGLRIMNLRISWPKLREKFFATIHRSFSQGHHTAITMSERLKQTLGRQDLPTYRLKQSLKRALLPPRAIRRSHIAKVRRSETRLRTVMLLGSPKLRDAQQAQLQRSMAADRFWAKIQGHVATATV